MKPMMDNELKHGLAPERLTGTLIRAIEAKRPRISYRLGTGWQLALMELLPDRWLDGMYRMYFRMGRKGV